MGNDLIQRPDGRGGPAGAGDGRDGAPLDNFGGRLTPGDAGLDRTVLSAVRSAAPFPAPPSGASPGQLRFTMPFYFQ